MGLLNHYYDKFTKGDKNNKNDKNKKVEVNPIHTEKVLDPLKGKLLEDEKFRTIFIIGLVFLVLWGMIDSFRKYSTPVPSATTDTSTSDSSYNADDIMKAFEEDLAKSQDLTKLEKSTLYDKRREEMYIASDEIILPSGKAMIINVPEGYQVDFTNSSVNEATYVGNKLGKKCQITIKSVEKVEEESIEPLVFKRYATQQDIASSTENFEVTDLEKTEINGKECFRYDVYDTRNNLLAEKTYIAYYLDNAEDGIIYIEINGTEFLEDSELENLLKYEIKEYNEELERKEILQNGYHVSVYTYSRSDYPGFSNFDFATYTGKIVDFYGGVQYRVYGTTDIYSLSLFKKTSDVDVNIVYSNIILKEKEDIDLLIDGERQKIDEEIKAYSIDPDYESFRSMEIESNSIVYKGFNAKAPTDIRTRYILYGYLGNPQDGCIKVDIKSIDQLKEEDLKEILSLELVKNDYLEAYKK